MKNYLLILFLLSVYSPFLKAQEVIIKVDSATGGKLIIKSEPAIMKMLDENEICKKSKKNLPSNSSNSLNLEKEKSKNTTPQNICGKRNDIPGFMIKIGEAKSEQEINSMMDKFRSEFPRLRVEKHYLRPDWRLLAGDYFKKESGQADLKNIRKNFPTAMLINWRIYCNRAK